MQEKIQYAQWILERNLAWISAAEVKIGVIVTIDTALLGSIGAVWSTHSGTSAWAYLYTFLACILLAAGIICASMALLPRVKGPRKSFIFFGPVAEMGSTAFSEEFAKATDAELLDDLTAQIHRNAEIAKEKFGWVRASMFWSLFSVLPWFGAILQLTS